MSLFGLPVAVTLGGRPFRAAEYRLADVFALEAWARSRTPCPFEAAAFELLHAPRDLAWRRAVLSVLEAIEDAPDPMAALGSAAGTAEQLFLALRRVGPAITRGDVAAAWAAGEAYPVATRLEVERILRVAWGVGPEDVIRSLIDGPTPEAGPADWPRLWHRYITEAGGAAPRFEDLTVSQFRAWARGGKGPDEDRDDAVQVATRRGEFFEGTDDDPA